MANEIISYLEMCSREGTSLQRGMNFALGGDHSVVLMSIRPNAPYRDRLEDDGTTLIYEGHDEPRSDAVLQPKIVDQPERTPFGAPTQNGRFHQAAPRALEATTVSHPGDLLGSARYMSPEQAGGAGRTRE